MEIKFRVSEIEVKAQFKSWGEVTQESTGTEVSWKAICPHSEGWDQTEAKKVSIMVRKELEAVLILDSKCRGAKLPDAGLDTLAAYQRMLTGSTESPVSDND